jgi:hypothetical protein
VERVNWLLRIVRRCSTRQSDISIIRRRAYICRNKRVNTVQERRNQCSSACIQTRLWAGRPGFNSRQEQWWDFFSSPPRPNRLWGPPNLLSNGYRWFRGGGGGGENGRGVKPTTHLLLVSRSKHVPLYFHSSTSSYGGA